MEVVLEDKNMKEFIDSDIPKLVASNAKDLAAWKKNVAKERMILLEGVRDHIVSYLHGKETPYAMCNYLIYLFHNNNENRKMALLCQETFVIVGLAFRHCRHSSLRNTMQFVTLLR